MERILDKGNRREKWMYGPSTHGAGVHSSVCNALAQTSTLLSSRCTLLYYFDLEELSKNNCPSSLPHY